MQAGAVITGGGSGIGEALVKKLIPKNLAIYIIGRNKDKLDKVAATEPTVIFPIVADISNEKDRSIIKDKLSNIKIKYLIHNAAVIEPMSYLKDINITDWRMLMNTNVEAPLFLTQQLLPMMDQTRILHISSGAAHFPAVGWGAYCVSKAALYMLYQCLREELKSEDVYVGSVKPGIVDTPMQAVLRNANESIVPTSTFFKKLKENQLLINSDVVAQFLMWLLFEVDPQDFIKEEWDIYEEHHHHLWLKQGIVPKVFE